MAYIGKPLKEKWVVDEPVEAPSWAPQVTPSTQPSEEPVLVPVRREKEQATWR